MITAEEKLQRIGKLLKEWDMSLTHKEFELEFMDQSVNDIKDEMWRMYCFINDVSGTLDL